MHDQPTATPSGKWLPRLLGGRVRSMDEAAGALGWFARYEYLPACWSSMTDASGGPIVVAVVPGFDGPTLLAACRSWRVEHLAEHDRAARHAAVLERWEPRVRVRAGDKEGE